VFIGFTGSRKGMTGQQVTALRRTIQGLRTATWFGHGDCVGADAEAHSVALVAGLYIRIFPPLLTGAQAGCTGHQYEAPRPYLVRNKAIVDWCDVLLAAPDSAQPRLRSGTWSTIRYAEQTGRDFIMLLP
jgi:hypothetical protein